MIHFSSDFSNVVICGAIRLIYEVSFSLGLFFPGFGIGQKTWEHFFLQDMSVPEG